MGAVAMEAAHCYVTVYLPAQMQLMDSVEASVWFWNWLVFYSEPSMEFERARKAPFLKIFHV